MAAIASPLSAPRRSTASPFFFSSRRRHTRWTGDWSSDVCSSDLSLGIFKKLLAYTGSTSTLYASSVSEFSTGNRAILMDDGNAPFMMAINEQGELLRSEERRVGKECRSWWSRWH